MSLITTPLFNQVLVNPAHECDELCIVSGYASPAFVQTHYYQLKELHTNTNIKINLIIGMIRTEGISNISHNSFVRLVSSLDKKFNCYYVINGAPTHAKVYVWLKQGQPIYAYAGSPNYSANGFYTNREAVSASETVSSYEFYKEILADSVHCTSAPLEKIKFRKEKLEAPTLVDKYKMTDVTEVSLLDSSGEIHTRSGLNWGQRENRNKNEAYIPVNKENRKSDFFPPKGIVFTVITDDQVSFELVRAQDGDKALETPQSNAILGAYFRKRLGLASGAFVTKQDLLNYGRTSVIFKKINDDLYYMDFSRRTT
jgi:hypothetical protein